MTKKKYFSLSSQRKRGSRNKILKIWIPAYAGMTISMNLKSQLESLLYITPRPLKVRDFEKWTKAKPEEIRTALAELATAYKGSDHGVLLQHQGDEYQLSTTPDNVELIREFIKEETTGELTKPQLETLTVISYRAPIAKSELDAIRGVNCALIIRNLLIRGLVKSHEERGELVYEPTLDFLKFLGVADTSELPDFERLRGADIFKQLLEEKKSS